MEVESETRNTKFSFSGQMDGVMHMSRQKSEFVGDEGFAFTTYVTLSVFL